jgi:N-glycosylase/DNA lyase
MFDCSSVRKKLCEELVELYQSVQEEINSQLTTFSKIWETGDDKEIFAELIFCILTPQCKPKPCWNIVQKLRDSEILLKGERKEIAALLANARFRYKKAAYIVEARKLFIKNDRILIKQKLKEFRDILITREWLVANVKGIGFKESSHFLRNIGLEKNFAILDRHILRNLVIFGVIKKIPNSIPSKTYIKIELEMKKFSERIGIPMDALDLLLWYKEKGVIFK